MKWVMAYALDNKYSKQLYNGKKKKPVIKNCNYYDYYVVFTPKSEIGGLKDVLIMLPCFWTNWLASCLVKKLNLGGPGRFGLHLYEDISLLIGRKRLKCRPLLES